MSVVLVLLCACSTTTTAPAVDAGSNDASPERDAEVRDARLPTDGPESDAALPADGGSGDGGPTGDAGSPLVDAGSLATDGGPPPTPDLGAPSDAGCVADVFETNDTPETAAPVPSTGWSFADYTVYAMTWSDGDTADWIASDLNSAGPVRVSAADTAPFEVGVAHDEVEVRVTCPHGLYACSGSSAVSVGNTCVGLRRGNAFVDVGCDFTAHPSFSVRVGVHHNAAATACEHSVSLLLSTL